MVMDLNSIADLIYAHLNSRLSLTQKNPKSLKIDGSIAKPKSLISLMPSDRELFEHGILPGLETNGKVLDILIAKVVEQSRIKLDSSLNTTVLGQDVISGENYLIEDGGLQPYHFDTFKNSIPEEQFGLLYEQREFVVKAFNPNRGLSWNDFVETTTGRKEYKHYNCYIQPEWKRHPSPDSYNLCEEYVRPFLEHFIPKEDERHYVLHWLNCLASQRLNDVLVLIGTQGNGKNTLMQLATIIAGKHNTIIGSKAFGKDKFNGEVYKRKLVNLDEYAIKGNAKESLKCFCNDDITVEYKGVDPRQVENHCSFIVANNSMRSTELEFKDRRFTCPTLSPKDLLLFWPKEKIAKFKEILNSDEFAIEFPHWLNNEVERLGISFPNQMNYITPQFYALVEAAKPEWFKEMKNMLVLQASINANDIFKAKRLKISNTRILEELKKESEERELRGIEPYEIAVPVVDEGKMNFESKIYKGKI